MLNTCLCIERAFLEAFLTRWVIKEIKFTFLYFPGGWLMSVPKKKKDINDCLKLKPSPHRWKVYGQTNPPNPGLPLAEYTSVKTIIKEITWLMFNLYIWDTVLTSKNG